MDAEKTNALPEDEEFMDFDVDAGPGDIPPEALEGGDDDE